MVLTTSNCPAPPPHRSADQHHAVDFSNIFFHLWPPAITQRMWIPRRVSWKRLLSVLFVAQGCGARTGIGKHFSVRVALHKAQISTLNKCECEI